MKIKYSELKKLGFDKFEDTVSDEITEPKIKPPAFDALDFDTDLTYGNGLCILPDYCKAMVIVCFGLNDSTKDIDGIKEYKDSLEKIFEKLYGIQTIFMTPNMTNSRVYEFETNAEIIKLMEETAKRQNTGVMDAYMDTARKVCIEYNVAICDCYKIWKDMERLGIDTVELLSNKINHPTENMHWLFAFELFKTILQINM